MKATLVPTHVSMTVPLPEVLALIVTLRAAIDTDNGLIGVPESISGILEALTAAYAGDLPPIDGEPSEGGSLLPR